MSKRLEEKKCPDCGVTKPRSEYYSNGKSIQAKCKECQRDVAREQKAKWYALNGQRQIEQQREKAYGVSPETYAEMLVKQKGRCAICFLPERASRNGKVKALAVDHDHMTGRVRGLLCSACNTGLGKFNDDPDNLSAAITYLEEASALASLEEEEECLG